MADLTITATSVVKGTNPSVIQGTAGATITAGQTVYLDTTTNTYKLADGDGASPLYVVAGVALNGAATGQPLTIQTGGDITIGATVASGIPYFQSATAGGICPAADLLSQSGNKTTLIGIGTSSTKIQLYLVSPGSAIA